MTSANKSKVPTAKKAAINDAILAESLAAV
jgi:hypothetical protein